MGCHLQADPNDPGTPVDSCWPDVGFLEAASLGNEPTACCLHILQTCSLKETHIRPAAVHRCAKRIRVCLQSHFCLLCHTVQVDCTHRPSPCCCCCCAPLLPPPYPCRCPFPATTPCAYDKLFTSPCCSINRHGCPLAEARPSYCVRCQHFPHPIHPQHHTFTHTHMNTYAHPACWTPRPPPRPVLCAHHSQQWSGGVEGHTAGMKAPGEAGHINLTTTTTTTTAAAAAAAHTHTHTANHFVHN